MSEEDMFISITKTECRVIKYTNATVLIFVIIIIFFFRKVEILQKEVSSLYETDYHYFYF